MVRFSASLTVTYNAQSLILPGGASIVVQPGDAMIAEYLGNSQWKVLFYQSSGGQQNSKIKPADTVLISTTTLTPDPDLQTNTLAVGRYSYELYLEFDSVAAGAGFKFTNDGSAVDARGNAQALAYGFVNAAAYGPKADPFYSTVVSYATVGTGANSNQVIYKGSLLVGTPGTFGVSWAQATSTASNTTLRAGSYLTTTLLNTGASSGAAQHIYTTPGSFTETIPAGFTTVTIEVFGASGGGGNALGTGIPRSAGGGGGGSGAYSRTTLSVVGFSGTTMAFVVGNGGATAGAGTASTVTAGTFTPLGAISAGGGNGGTTAPSAFIPGNGGTGGTSTGGNIVNTPGNPGQQGTANTGGGTGGFGGFGVAGIATGGNPGGIGAFTSTFAGNVGQNGVIAFTYG